MGDLQLPPPPQMKDKKGMIAFLRRLKHQNISNPTFIPSCKESEYFGVKINPSDPLLLKALEKAKNLRSIGLDLLYELLKIIYGLIPYNAYEFQDQSTVFKKIVFDPSTTMSFALEQNAGCCRYMSILLQMLCQSVGIEAHLYFYEKDFKTVFNVMKLDEKYYVFSPFAFFTNDEKKSYIKNINDIYTGGNKL